MDPKNQTPVYVMLGILTLAVGGLGVGVVTQKTGQGYEPVKMGDGSVQPIDVMAAQVASISNDVVKTCTRERVGTKDGIVLKWSCGGGVMPETTQAELDKLATKDAVSITFTPRDDHGTTVLDAKVQEGVLPNLDPVPVAVAVAEEPKPVDNKPIGDAEKLP